jgi:nitroreductase
MIEDVLRARRSVRRFKPDAVPRQLLARVLEVATTAPSASNKQPWRFFVVETRATIDAMAAAVRAALARLEAAVPEESRAAFAAYGDYFTRFEGAPAVVVPAYRGHAVLSHLVEERAADLDRALVAAMERDSALVGTSLALMSLLLAAHEAGLGASVMTGPLVAAPALRALLGVPETFGLVALVPVGFPDEAPSPTDRKPIGHVVRWL